MKSPSNRTNDDSLELLLEGRAVGDVPGVLNVVICGLDAGLLEGSMPVEVDAGTMFTAFSVTHCRGTQPYPGQASTQASTSGISPPTKGTLGAIIALVQLRAHSSVSQDTFQYQARKLLSL